MSIKVAMALLMVVLLTWNLALATQSERSDASILLTGIYPASTISRGKEVCPSTDELQDLQEGTENHISALMDDLVKTTAPCDSRTLGLLERCPATSCDEILQSSSEARPSGRYWLKNTDGRVLHLYCGMGSVCGTSGGWVQIASLDMGGSTCPPTWRSLSDSCGRTSYTTSSGVETITFTSHGREYNRVCGRIYGQQNGHPDGFSVNYDIDSYYVDGVSVTHGYPRNHIWSFAGTNRKEDSARNIPSFVGNDYFCDSDYYDYTGYYTIYTYRTYYDSSTYTYRLTFDTHTGSRILTAQSSSPLWAGGYCSGVASGPCCGDVNNPPWFVKELSGSTSDDIEVRLMGMSNEDTPIESIELYIQ